MPRCNGGSTWRDTRRAWELSAAGGALALALLAVLLVAFARAAQRLRTRPGPLPARRPAHVA
jgi:hypothetical protein